MMILHLRAWRERRGWTQAELAERAGVRQATVSDLERKAEAGRLQRLDLAVLDQLARALRTSAEGLFRAPGHRSADRPSAPRRRRR